MYRFRKIIINLYIANKDKTKICQKWTKAECLILYQTQKLNILQLPQIK